MKAKDYFGFKEMFTYFFRKKDPNRPVNFNIKAMHWTNRISIIMFLIGLIIILIRYISRNF
jgi:hypothetical protein